MWKMAAPVGLVLASCQHVSAQVISINLPSNALMYSESQDMLYAVIPGHVPKIGNTLTQINPATLEVGDSVFVGSEPFRMARSSSGNTMYVALQGSPQLTQVELTTLTNVRTFPLGNASQFAEDMAVQPGTENVVAVARRNFQFTPHGEGLAIYEDGVARPNVEFGVCYICFSDDPTRMYGFDQETTAFDFKRLNVDENGVTRVNTFDNLFTESGVQIQFAGGRVYGSNGVVVDPELGVILGTFEGIFGAPMIELHANRAIFVGVQGTAIILQAYSLDTFALIDSRFIIGAQGGVHKSVRWGKSGLAYNTFEGKIFSLQSSIVWKPIVVPAESLSIVTATVVSGNLSSLQTSNDQRLVLRPGVVFSTALPPVNFEVTATAPDPAAEDLSFMLESNGTSANIRQVISLYDYDANQWVAADLRQLTTSDTRVHVDRIGDGNRFIEPGTSKVRARITCRAMGPIPTYPWEARFDTARWTFPE